MKIAVTSDFHGNLPEIEQSDLLCICGDICPASNHSLTYQSQWLQNIFVPWINNLDVKKVILIAGNHDFWFEHFGKKLNIVNNQLIEPTYNKLVYLHNAEYEYKDLKIFGTPYCKEFLNWAFMRDENKLKEKFEKIPYGLDILLSHDAPMLKDVGVILDSYEQKNVGNSVLADFILDRKTKYAFCGHIHSGNHKLQTVENTKIANVSLCNEQYEPINDILYLDIEK
jgi:predicted phosphohydrolase